MSHATIRMACAEDAESIAAIYAPSVSERATSFELAPPTPGEMAQRMAMVRVCAPWLVCVIGGEVIGYAYASRHHPRAAYQWALDSAIYVDERHHQRGVAKALYTTLFNLVRLQGYHVVHAGVTLPNPASVALHESFGFAPVGVYQRVGYKFGAWHDVGWWQLELRERRGPPAPLSTPELKEAEEPEAWAAAFASGTRLVR